MTELKFFDSRIKNRQLPKLMKSPTVPVLEQIRWFILRKKSDRKWYDFWVNRFYFSLFLFLTLQWYENKYE